MKKEIIVFSTALGFVIGGLAGFYISQEYFPKLDYGYAKEGGNKIVNRVENPQQPTTYKVSKIVIVAQNNCYATEGFRNKTPIETTLFINGEEVEQ